MTHTTAALPLKDWLKEREANCLRIANTKTSSDKAGWLEDASYFSKCIEQLSRAPAVQVTSPAVDERAMEQTSVWDAADEIVESFIYSIRGATDQTRIDFRQSIAAIIRKHSAVSPKAEADWQPIETAPKGYPALEEPSEWFLAYGPNRGPRGAKWAVIRRCFGHGFGPWECTGDAYYKADFYTHWKPLPEPPASPPAVSVGEQENERT